MLNTYNGFIDAFFDQILGELIKNPTRPLAFNIHPQIDNHPDNRILYDGEGVLKQIIKNVLLLEKIQQESTLNDQLSPRVVGFSVNPVTYAHKGIDYFLMAIAARMVGCAVVPMSTKKIQDAFKEMFNEPVLLVDYDAKKTSGENLPKIGILSLNNGELKKKDITKTTEGYEKEIEENTQKIQEIYNAISPRDYNYFYKKDKHPIYEVFPLLVLLQGTSGSTGNPKLTPVLLPNLIKNIKMLVEDGFTRDDYMINVVPAFTHHDMQLVSAFMALMMGGMLVPQGLGFGKDIIGLPKRIEDYIGSIVGPENVGVGIFASNNAQMKQVAKQIQEKKEKILKIGKDAALEFNDILDFENEPSYFEASQRKTAFNRKEEFRDKYAKFLKAINNFTAEEFQEIFGLSKSQFNLLLNSNETGFNTI